MDTVRVSSATVSYDTSGCASAVEGAPSLSAAFFDRSGLRVHTASELIKAEAQKSVVSLPILLSNRLLAVRSFSPITCDANVHSRSIMRSGAE